MQALSAVGTRIQEIVIHRHILPEAKLHNPRVFIL